MDQKSRSGLPMAGEDTALEALASPLSRNGLPLTGEDTGLEALASPLAGYLGKVSRLMFSSRCCHLRKAELNLNNTLRESNIPNSTKGEKLQYTEIFESKRRKCLVDLKIALLCAETVPHVI